MRQQEQLRAYQRLIIDHALNVERCAVWAGMGLGKTASTLTVCSALNQVEDDPILVLAPLRVAQSTWPKESKEWEHLNHLRIQPVVGSEQDRRRSLSAKADIYTCNYDNLVWLQEFYGDRWPFKTVVSDEATRLKSFRLRQGGKRTQALGKVAHSHIRRFIELTGTPAPNGLQDLWGQMWFLDAGQRLGRTFSGFKDRWFRPSQDGYGSVPLEGAQEDIQSRLKDICLTIDAKDWFDLDAPIVTNILVDLPPRARLLYKDMEKTMFMQIDGHDIEAFNAAAKTQKLLQLASGAVYVDPLVESDSNPKSKDWKVVHDEKIDALKSVIEDANGAPVMVAYHFRSDLARLLKAFPQGRHLDKNPKTEDEWNSGRIPVLFVHPQSAGHGLNLQHGGNILVFFSHSWNLEERLQVIERIGPVRQKQSGYERPVFLYNIISADTADELVMARVEGKREVQDILLGYMKRKGY